MIEQLKSYLLRLHELGLLPERVAGKKRRIGFQNNPPSKVLKVDPSHPEFPEKFKQIEYSARSKDILACHRQNAGWKCSVSTCLVQFPKWFNEVES